MPEVPRQILNYYRRDMHASDTIISADHPDARPVTEKTEQEVQPETMPVLQRMLGRFTVNTSQALDNDGKGRRP